QAQSASLLLARILGADSFELREHVRHLVRSETDSRVTDGDLDAVAAVNIDSRRDPPTLGRELHSIAEEVEHDLLDSDGVLVHQRDVFIDLKGELLRLTRRERADNGMDAAKHFRKIELLRREVHLAGLDLRQIQDLIDELQ